MAKIQHLLDKIRTAIYGKEVRGSLADGLEAINKETEDATEVAVNVEQRQDAVEQQFDDVLNEWTSDKPISNEETIAARTNRNTGENHQTLGQRLDAENKKVTAQLADIENLENYELNSKARKSQGIVSFISDDSHKDDYEVLLPIFRNAGVPYCVAAIPYRIMTNPNYCTVEQLKEIEEEGNEILSHSMNHPYNPPMVENPNDVEVEKEFSESLEWFKERGFNVQSYVYPGGNYKKRERLFARKYYRSARNSDRGYHDGINYTPLNQYELKTYWVDPTIGNVRDWLNQGYSMSQVHTMVINRVAELVNEANTKKGWLIISTHSYELNTPELRALFTDVVNYVKNNARVMTMRDALNEMGNVVDIGDYSEKPHRYGLDGSTHFVVGADGIISGSATVTERNMYTALTPFEEFPYGVTYTPINTAHAEGTPRGEAGILITYKLEGNQLEFNRQEFKSFRSTTRQYSYVRFVTDDGGFTDWKVDGGVFYDDLHKYDLNTPISEFKYGVTYSVITFDKAQNSNLPDKRGGHLITYKIGDRDYQEYKVLPGNVLRAQYVRSVNPDGSYGPWRLYTPGMRFPEDNNFDHTTPFTTFPVGITYSMVQGNNPNISSAPEGSNGTLITYKLRDRGLYGYSFQEYHLFKRSTVYKRYAQGDAEWTGWSEWVKIAD